jgi:hypothetical protein
MTGVMHAGMTIFHSVIPAHEPGSPEQVGKPKITRSCFWFFVSRITVNGQIK